MRYTTIIDITELPSVYKNKNARLIYLHMVLRSGYHDNDRDVIDTSIRRLASEIGTTVSTVRHALKLLERNGLITRDSERTKVTKWLQQEAITARPKKNQPTATEADRSIAERERADAEEYYRRLDEGLRNATWEQLETWLAELRDGISKRHFGIYLPANKRGMAYIEKELKRR